MKITASHRSPKSSSPPSQQPSHQRTQTTVYEYKTRASPAQTQHMSHGHKMNNVSQTEKISASANEKALFLAMAISSQLNKSTKQRNFKSTLNSAKSRGSRSGSKQNSKKNKMQKTYIPRKVKEEFYRQQKELISNKEQLLEVSETKESRLKRSNSTL